jgi:hypothetical protein
MPESKRSKGGVHLISEAESKSSGEKRAQIVAAVVVLAIIATAIFGWYSMSEESPEDSAPAPTSVGASFFIFVRTLGIEPRTSRVSVVCSTS